MRKSSKKKRLAWALGFGQMERGELEEKARKDLSVIYAGVWGYLFGLLAEGKGPQEGEGSKDPLVEALSKRYHTPPVFSFIIYSHDAVREFLREVLFPLREDPLSPRDVKLETPVRVSAIPVVRVEPLVYDLLLKRELSYEDVRAVVYSAMLELLNGVDLNDLKECEICGALFYPLNKRKRARFCSVRCRNTAAQRAFQARKRAEKKENPALMKEGK